MKLRSLLQADNCVARYAIQKQAPDSAIDPK